MAKLWEIVTGRDVWLIDTETVIVTSLVPSTTGFDCKKERKTGCRRGRFELGIRLNFIHAPLVYA